MANVCKVWWSHGSLVDAENSAVNGARVLHVFHAVHAERDDGTAGAQEEAEEGSHEEGHVPVLVGDVCGDVVAVGAGDGDWGGAKHHLQGRGEGIYTTVPGFQQKLTLELWYTTILPLVYQSKFNSTIG